MRTARTTLYLKQQAELVLLRAWRLIRPRASFQQGHSEVKAALVKGHVQRGQARESQRVQFVLHIHIGPGLQALQDRFDAFETTRSDRDVQRPPPARIATSHAAGGLEPRGNDRRVTGRRGAEARREGLIPGLEKSRGVGR